MERRRIGPYIRVSSTCKTQGAGILARDMEVWDVLCTRDEVMQGAGRSCSVLNSGHATAPPNHSGLWTKLL